MQVKIVGLAATNEPLDHDVTGMASDFLTSVEDKRWRDTGSLPMLLRKR